MCEVTPDYSVVFNELAKGLDSEQTERVAIAGNFDIPQILRELRTVTIGGRRQSGKTHFAISKVLSKLASETGEMGIYIARDANMSDTVKTVARTMAAELFPKSMEEHFSFEIHRCFRHVVVSRPDPDSMRRDYGFNLDGLFYPNQDVPNKLFVVMDDMPPSAVRACTDYLALAICHREFNFRARISPHDITILRIVE